MQPADKLLTVSVTQLNEYVKSLLGTDPLLRGFALRGEISNFKRHSSGHLYFSVKDAQSVMRCVMFRQNAMSLRFAPRDGQQVVLHGYVSFYTRDGQIQFYCESMQPDGVGALYQEFERNKARFAAEGLFDPAHKRALPALVRCIGVVTSPTGAVIRDIIRVAHRRNPSVDILLYPCKVQGEGAASSIAEGVRTLGKQDVDVIIVGRGGGSLEDLWAFNEEAVVRAVYASRIPVISAVGHETDFALSDFAADARASTPSNAAELAVMDVRDALQHLDQLSAALRAGALYALDSRTRQLDALRQRAAFRNPAACIDRRQEQLDTYAARLKNGAQVLLARQSETLASLSGRLSALNPEAVLRRGYAVVLQEGHAVTRVNQVKPGSELSIRVTDGTLSAVVKKTEERA